MRKRIMTEAMYEKIPTLLNEGLTKHDIALQYGVTLNSLITLCAQRGISLRKGGCSNCYDFRPKGHTLKSFKDTAISLGMTESTLVNKLLETIAKDNLYNAVLDT